MLAPPGAASAAATGIAAAEGGLGFCWGASTGRLVAPPFSFEPGALAAAYPSGLRVQALKPGARVRIVDEQAVLLRLRSAVAAIAIEQHRTAAASSLLAHLSSAIAPSTSVPGPTASSTRSRPSSASSGTLSPAPAAAAPSGRAAGAPAAAPAAGWAELKLPVHCSSRSDPAIAGITDWIVAPTMNVDVPASATADALAAASHGAAVAAGGAGAHPAAAVVPAAAAAATGRAASLVSVGSTGTTDEAGSAADAPAPLLVTIVSLSTGAVRRLLSLWLEPLPSASSLRSRSCATATARTGMRSATALPRSEAAPAPEPFEADEAAAAALAVIAPEEGVMRRLCALASANTVKLSSNAAPVASSISARPDDSDKCEPQACAEHAAHAARWLLTYYTAVGASPRLLKQPEQRAAIAAALEIEDLMHSGPAERSSSDSASGCGGTDSGTGAGTGGLASAAIHLAKAASFSGSAASRAASHAATSMRIPGDLPAPVLPGSAACSQLFFHQVLTRMEAAPFTAADPAAFMSVALADALAEPAVLATRTRAAAAPAAASATSAGASAAAAAPRTYYRRPPPPAHLPPRSPRDPLSSSDDDSDDALADIAVRGSARHTAATRVGLDAASAAAVGGAGAASSAAAAAAPPVAASCASGGSAVSRGLIPHTVADAARVGAASVTGSLQLYAPSLQLLTEAATTSTPRAGSGATVDGTDPAVAGASASFAAAALSATCPALERVQAQFFFGDPHWE